MSDRPAKLLRLILDPSAADGERLNAAGMLSRYVSAEGIDVGEIQWCPATTAPMPVFDQATIQRYRSMPFGKYKGTPIQNIPTDYLIWIATVMENPSPWLHATAVTVLVERGANIEPNPR